MAFLELLVALESFLSALLPVSFFVVGSFLLMSLMESFLESVVVVASLLSAMTVVVASFEMFLMVYLLSALTVVVASFDMFLMASCYQR